MLNGMRAAGISASSESESGAQQVRCRVASIEAVRLLASVCVRARASRASPLLPHPACSACERKAGKLEVKWVVSERDRQVQQATQEVIWTKDGSLACDMNIGQAL